MSRHDRTKLNLLYERRIMSSGRGTVTIQRAVLDADAIEFLKGSEPVYTGRLWPLKMIKIAHPNIRDEEFTEYEIELTGNVDYDRPPMKIRAPWDDTEATPADTIEVTQDVQFWDPGSENIARGRFIAQGGDSWSTDDMTSDEVSRLNASASQTADSGEF